MNKEIKEILDFLKEPFDKGKTHKALDKKDTKILLDYITDLQEKNKKLNNIIINLDKMFEYYFIGNNKYDQETVNTICIKYIKLKESEGSDK